MNLSPFVAFVRFVVRSKFRGIRRADGVNQRIEQLSVFRRITDKQGEQRGAIG